MNIQFEIPYFLSEQALECVESITKAMRNPDYFKRVKQCTETIIELNATNNVLLASLAVELHPDDEVVTQLEYLIDHGADVDLCKDHAMFGGFYIDD